MECTPRSWNFEFHLVRLAAVLLQQLGRSTSWRCYWVHVSVARCFAVPVGLYISVLTLQRFR